MRIEIVSHGALYAATVMGILYALILELLPLTMSSPAMTAQNIPNICLSFLICLSSNLYTPKPGERKSLEDNTLYCTGLNSLFRHTNKQTNIHLPKLA